jgi:hypothetical protein
MLKTVIDLARIARARMNGSPPAMPTARLLALVDGK